jgi:FixJ family two-component response regulator
MRELGPSAPPVRAISIVEDDESLRNAVVGLLRSIGQEACGFGTAEEFLLEPQSRFTCVITDIQLPGMSGVEMLRRLRERGDNVPVIVITAREEKRWVSEARSAGALCLLRKPFETQALLDCLDRAFKT